MKKGWLSILFVLMLFFSCASEKETYQVQMVRDDRVGDVYEFMASGWQQVEEFIYQGEDVLTVEQSLTAVLNGTRKVLAVDRKHRSVSIEIIVEKCEIARKKGDVFKKILDPGSRVTVRRINNAREFIMDGKPLPQDARAVFDLLITLAGESDVDDDQVFGTSEPRFVGDQWPIDTAAFVKGLGTETINLPGDTLKGEVTLEKIVDINGIRCLELKGRIDASKLSIAQPGGFPLENGVFYFTFSTKLPMDTSLQALFAENRLDIEFTGKTTLKDQPDKVLPMRRFIRKQLRVAQKPLVE